jgi:hypothetical protein
LWIRSPVAATRPAATRPTSFLEGGGVRVGLGFDGLLEDLPASFALKIRNSGYFDIGERKWLTRTRWKMAGFAGPLAKMLNELLNDW